MVYVHPQPHIETQEQQALAVRGSREFLLLGAPCAVVAQTLELWVKGSLRFSGRVNVKLIAPSNAKSLNPKPSTHTQPHTPIQWAKRPHERKAPTNPVF